MLAVAMSFALFAPSCAEARATESVNSFLPPTGHRESGVGTDAAADSAAAQRRRTVLEEVVDPEEQDSATAGATEERHESRGGSGGGNDGGNGVGDGASGASGVGAGKEEEAPLPKTTKQPKPAPPRKRAARKKGRKEVDYDALVGDATDDSVKVVLPTSPGEAVPSWHPHRNKRLGRSGGRKTGEGSGGGGGGGGVEKG